MTHVPSLRSPGPARLVCAVVAGIAACVDSEDLGGPRLPPPGPLVPVIVSNVFGGPAPAGPGLAALSLGVAYVSLAPASLTTGVAATITNTFTGVSTTALIVDGGLDPVAVPATVGDSLKVTVTEAGGAQTVIAKIVVPPVRRPIVVRTDPPPRKRDVPLNASLLVVFSEPMDPASLGPGSIQLRKNGVPVPGTVGALPGMPWIAELTPEAPLDPASTYELVITQGNTDLDGDPLEAEVRLTFTTASGSITLAPSTVAAGVHHACGLDADGAAYCWGGNLEGQLGNGTTTGSWTPTAVSGGLTFREIHAGWYFTCGLTKSGSAWCWGSNGAGALGNGTTANSPSPVPVAGGLTFTTLSTGTNHTCGLTPSGAAYCWGEASLEPVRAAPGMTLTSIAAGGAHTCGLDASGQAYCWGDGASGQLGNGSTTSSLGPVAVSGGLAFIDLVAGTNYTCGIAVSGAAYCWGANGLGQLGASTPIISWDEATFSATPVLAGGGLRFVALAARWGHTCGIATTGMAYCWGANGDGQLGAGNTAFSLFNPVAVTGGLTFGAIAVGYDFTCGQSIGGSTHCWGTNLSGQLGQPREQSWVPAPPAGLPASLQVRAGADHTCALSVFSAVYCWGDNYSGMLGDGTRISRSTPVVVTTGETFTELAPGGELTCALDSSGAPSCWGALAGTSSTIPASLPGSPAFVSLVAGGRHACGLTSTGLAYCWGDNSYGELGNNSNVIQAAPAPVSGGLVFQTLGAGDSSTCGLTDAGLAYCWGSNWIGKLGNGGSADSRVPVPVAGGLVFSALDVGWWSACGLTPGGQAYCWGFITNTSTPTAISGGPAFSAIAVGAAHACGLTATQQVYCWGANSQGQLAYYPDQGSAVPVAVPGSFRTVSALAWYTCGLTTRDEVLCWGDNYFGQLGRGTFGYATVPLPVAPF